GVGADEVAGDQQGGARGGGHAGQTNAVPGVAGDDVGVPGVGPADGHAGRAVDEDAVGAVGAGGGVAHDAGLVAPGGGGGGGGVPGDAGGRFGAEGVAGAGRGGARERPADERFGAVQQHADAVPRRVRGRGVDEVPSQGQVLRVDAE